MKIRAVWKDADFLYRSDLSKQLGHEVKLEEKEYKSGGKPYKYKVAVYTEEQRCAQDAIYDAMSAAGLGEYLTVEFDTCTGKAEVIKV